MEARRQLDEVQQPHISNFQGVSQVEVFNFIDGFRFLWQIKLFIIIGLLLGTVSAGFWPSIPKLFRSEINFVEDMQQQPPTNLNFEARQGLIHEIANEALTSREFFLALYKSTTDRKGKKVEFKSKDVDADYQTFIELQKRDEFKIKRSLFTTYLQSNGLILELNLPFKVARETIETSAMTVINRLIEEFNQNNKMKSKNQLETLQKLKAEQLTIKSDAYSLYYHLLRSAKDHGLSIEYEMQVNQEKNGELESFERASERIIKFIGVLSTIDSPLVEKSRAELISLQARYQLVNQLLQSTTWSSGFSILFPLKRAFRGEQHILASNDTDFAKGIFSLQKRLLLGVLLGAFLGVTFGAIFVFCQKNWGLISTIVGSEARTPSHNSNELSAHQESVPI